MNSKSMIELFEKIEAFNDNGVITAKVIEISKEFNFECENQIDTYWLNEAASNLEGMFTLLMDLKKSYELEKQG